MPGAGFRRLRRPAMASSSLVAKEEEGEEEEEAVEDDARAVDVLSALTARGGCHSVSGATCKHMGPMHTDIAKKKMAIYQKKGLYTSCFCTGPSLFYGEQEFKNPSSTTPLKSPGILNRSTNLMLQVGRAAVSAFVGLAIGTFWVQYTAVTDKNTFKNANRDLLLTRIQEQTKLLKLEHHKDSKLYEINVEKRSLLVAKKGRKEGRKGE